MNIVKQTAEGKTVKQLPTYFEVVGNDIYLGSHKIGTLNTEMWSTMTDLVVEMLENDTTQLEKDHEEALKEAEDDYAQKLEEWEDKVEDLKEEVSGLEALNREQEEILNRLELAEGVLGRIKELEEENDEWREKVSELSRKVRELTPKPKRNYNRRVA